MTTDYATGNFHAMTLGEFVSLLIDSGGDPAVLMRVVSDGPSMGFGFIRRLDVAMLPQDQVARTIQEVQPETIHKVLAKLIEEGVVK